MQIKSSSYSRYYAEACNEWRGPSSRISARTVPKKHHSSGDIVSDLTGLETEPLTFFTNTDVFNQLAHRQVAKNIESKTLKRDYRIFLGSGVLKLFNEIYINLF